MLKHNISQYYRLMIGHLRTLIVVVTMIGMVHGSCNVTEIKNIVTNQLLFAGNASTSSSSTNNVYFLFYGISGVTDRAQLSGHPTLVVFGNPGSSSHYLNFGGFGPMILTSNLTLAANPNSASKYANLLFIDPLGVGFSFVNNTKDIPTSYIGMAQQITYALGEIKKNVDFGKGKWIFVGESTWIRTIYGFQNLDDNLIGIVSLSPWGDMYDVGKYYGVAGVELGLLTNSQKNTIESTFTTCYLYIKNGKFADAHKCYDDTLNFASSKTNNHNFYNVKLNSTLIDTFAKVQYYLAQSAVVHAFLAPTSHLFQYQSNIFQTNTYAEISQNISQNISYFMRDYLAVKYFFVTGTLDYITYYKATRSWLESLNFMQSADFKSKNLTDVTVDGKVVGQGKAVKQVKYVELADTGHYPFIDQPAIMNSLLKDWVGTVSGGQKESNLIIEEQS